MGIEASRLERFPVKNKLMRLVYRSTSLLPADDDAALDVLFRASIRNNKRDQITGCLAQPDGHFVQVIEGEEGRIHALMDRIRADARHQGLIVLDQRPIPARLFNGWAMARPDTTPLADQAFRIIDESGSGAQVTGVLLNLVNEPDALYPFV